MPITGFLYTAMGGFPVPFFGLYDLARLVPENKPVAEVFKYAHLTLQYVLYLTALLHVAGALQHHLVRKDFVLRRMLSSTAPLPELRRYPLDKAPADSLYEPARRRGAGE
jgi:cytochrome b561